METGLLDRFYIPFWALVSLIFGAVLVIFFLRYVREMTRARQTRAILAVMEQYRPDTLIRDLPELYARFARGEFGIADIKKDISRWGELLWRLDRIGALLRYGYVAADLLIPLLFHTSIRLWLIFEEYIREVRKVRPRAFLMFEYLVAVCLMRRSEVWPTAEDIVFCDPPHYGEAKRVFDQKQLDFVLQRMETDLRRHGHRPHLPIKSSLRRLFGHR